jgi:hypothetical protein
MHARRRVAHVQNFLEIVAVKYYGYGSRKFVLAAIFAVTGCAVFAFTTKLSGGEFVTFAGLILSTFTAGDVVLNQIHKNNPDVHKDGERDV